MAGVDEKARMPVVNRANDFSLAQRGKHMFYHVTVDRATLLVSAVQLSKVEMPGVGLADP
jgi:hypothetical protein